MNGRWRRVLAYIAFSTSHAFMVMVYASSVWPGRIRCGLADLQLADGRGSDVSGQQA